MHNFFFFYHDQETRGKMHFPIFEVNQWASSELDLATDASKEGDNIYKNKQSRKQANNY